MLAVSSQGVLPNVGNQNTSKKPLSHSELFKQLNEWTDRRFPCAVCLEADQKARRVCNNHKCTANVCAKCFAEYIKSMVAGSLIVCRAVHCPGGCGSVIPFKKWSPSVDEATSKKYKESAVSALTLQCYGYHSRRSLFREPPTTFEG